MQFQINRYTILKTVADYGLSSLLLAFEKAANRIVLIKRTMVVREHYTLFQERFQNEIQIANSLDHRNIVPLVDYGWLDDSYYTVMNHFDGCDLGTLISDPEFDYSIGLMILTLVLQTLHHCHIKGIAHCDLKPANLLIANTGQVLLTDFGMSRMITTAHYNNYFATPMFLPPESVKMIDKINLFDNIELENTVLISCRNDLLPSGDQLLKKSFISQDVWAAGVLLYRICTGCYPFYSNSLSTLFSSIVQSNPMNLNNFRCEVPKSIISVIGQCLQKNPDQRLSSMDPILNVLHEHFHSQGVSLFDEYIAYYLKQKNNLLQFSFNAEEFSGVNIHDENQPVLEQPFNKAQGNGKKVLRHLSAPTYSLPQISNAPTVKIDTRIIRARATLHDSKKVFQVVRTLARMYRVHLVLITAILLIVSLAVFSGTFFIKRFSNKDSIYTADQHTSKNRHSREMSQKKNGFPSLMQHKKNDTISEKSANQKGSISSQNFAVSEKVSAESAYQGSTPVSSQKVSPPVQQLNSRKNTVSTARVNPVSISKKRASVPVVEDSSRVENDIEQTGKLKITVDPPQATVFIDGMLLDKDEIAVGKDLTIGNYTITAEAPEYQSYSNTIVIEKNQSIVLSIVLRAEEKSNGQVHVYSYPWANLYIDGELRGTTPTAVPILLSEGSHNLKLQRDGYESYADQIVVKSGDALRLKVDMKKID
ncbi:MAG TPA: serine/threonine-protein kinase [Chitinispirillaceae bacterium]|nr:serine/threonine-protein kinase [Chitinispirillaceae bacterium]